MILVLWAIAFLGFITIELMQQVRVDIDVEMAKEKNFRAIQLAEMGIAFGLHPEIEDDDPLLRKTLNNTESFQVERSTEEAKLNINELLKEANKEDGEKQTLRTIFTEWGLNSSDIDSLIDKMLDWVDDNEFERLKGAESQAYQRAGLRKLPRNSLFQTVDEMQYVMGIDILNEYQPNWPDFFTVYGNGQLDVMETNAETLSAVLGIHISDAESFISLRDGQDEIPNTEDDYEFEDIDTALDALGIVRSFDRDQAKELITLEGSIQRITSTGKIKTSNDQDNASFYERKITVIMNGGNRSSSNGSGNNSRPSSTSSNVQYIKWQIE